ncbi:MAG: histidinol-phosphatase [Rhizobiaceae bacterium]
MQEEELEGFLHHLADVAARETLPRFRKIENVDNKLSSGFDPVTEADQEAERAIRKAIIDKWPDHGVIGEEFGDHQADAEYCWVVDPVDGTRAFVVGMPLWGTLIALCRNMIPIAGIMSQSFTDEKFVGLGGKSMFFHKDERSEISTSGTKNLSDAIVMTTAPEIFDDNEFRAFKKVADRCKLVRYGGDCYAYCMLAAGHIELVIEAGLNFYDMAALVPIIEGSGGVITDWAGSQNPQGGNIIAAANPKIHSTALEILKQTFPA